MTADEQPRQLRAVPAAEPGDDDAEPGQAAYTDVTEPGARRPVLPHWARSRQQLRDTTRVQAGYAWYLARFHGLRLPLYVAMTLFWGVAGVFWLLLLWLRWWLSPVPAEAHAQAAGDGWRAWKSLHMTHRRITKIRSWISGAVIVVAAAVAELMFGVARWLEWPAAAAVLGTAAALGRPEGIRIVQPARVPSQYERLTQDVVTRALGSLRLSGINQWLREGKPLTFPTPVRQDGPGWLVDVELPHGVTAAMVVEKRAELASGLRRPLGSVWPEPVTGEHPGRLAVWVGLEDVAKRKPPPWPLLKAASVDVFKPIPFATSTRGRPVKVPMIFANFLIGSLPRQGKTCAVRHLCCAAALDPTCELWVHELKGTGDLDPLQAVSHRFVSGIDDGSIAYAAESLAMLRAECIRRGPRIKALPLSLAPQKKITREVASRRSLRLWPLLCTIDEAQNLFAHKKYGKQAGEDAEFVIKVGPAMGIMLILATQRPDKDSVPTGVSAQVAIRFCLYVMGQTENDMILGTSSYQNGLRATQFRPEIDAGLGILKGATPAPVVARTYLHDVPDAGAAVARARVLRERAGTLTGVAIGEDPDAPARNPAGDALAVFRDNNSLPWDVMAERLAQGFPDRWAGATGASVSADLRAAGVLSVTVSLDGEKARGCRKRDVEAAAP